MANTLLTRIKTVKDVVNVFKNQVLNEEVYYGIDEVSEKENYQIAICQNGKFAVTFDTGKKLNFNIKNNLYTFKPLLKKLNSKPSD
ncbi:hypothetical protein C1646_427055 [Rhizophagus diaphanus]|nr:hypothetical protein C1646_427055 [Rhizophagus diaphanus] [Rhizophagus sp. MUCL 43196]